MNVRAYWPNPIMAPIMSPLVGLAIFAFVLAVFSAMAIDLYLACIMLGIGFFAIFLNWRYERF